MGHGGLAGYSGCREIPPGISQNVAESYGNSNAFSAGTRRTPLRHTPAEARGVPWETPWEIPRKPKAAHAVPLGRIYVRHV